MRNSYWTVPLCGLAALVCTTAAARVYVDVHASGSETGDSWRDARRSIGAALDGAAPGDEIWIAAGVYREGRELGVKVPNLRVRGGFKGFETDPSERMAGESPTVVDGNGEHRCFEIAATNVLLDGLTLARGLAVVGGGIRNRGAQLTVQNCVITNCCAEGAGDGQGGGIRSEQPLRVLDSAIVACSNLFGANRNGLGCGIVFDSDGTLLLSNTVFRGNASGEENTGTAWHGCGGAIFLFRGTLDAWNCTFDSNRAIGHTASRHGGAIYGGTLRINQCTFYDNRATGQGGAIYTDGDVAITNSIFWANAARNGGPADLHARSVRITHSCLSGVGGENILATDPLALSAVLTGDPLFVNPAGHDFRLRSGRTGLGADGNAGHAALPGEMPLVENRSANRFERTTAVLGLELLAGQWADGVLYWGATDGGTEASVWEHAAPVPDTLLAGRISHAELPLLAPRMTYYYRGYATNATGDGWAPSTGTFRTGDLRHGSSDPRVIHVDAANTCPFQDGSCWTYAYRDLATAWDRLRGETNTLWIAAGTYSCGKTLQSALPELHIYGGFSGEEAAPEQRDAASHLAVIAGLPGKDPQPSRRLMEFSGAHVTLDGLTFAGGAATQNNDGGGAIKSRAGMLDVVNCTFVTNAATGQPGKGGALYLLGDARIRNCLFRGNASGRQVDGEGDGGAICFEKPGGALEIRNCAFHDNACTSWDLERPRRGGAVCADAGESGRVVVAYCTFYANTAGSDGGAIAALAGSLAVSNSIFWADRHGKQIAGYGREIWLGGKATLRMEHSNVDTQAVAGAGARLFGPALQNTDPFFADTNPPVDLHLQSQFGRWTPGGFVNDRFTSPCLGLGAYGNTPQASRGP